MHQPQTDYQVHAVYPKSSHQIHGLFGLMVVVTVLVRFVVHQVRKVKHAVQHQSQNVAGHQNHVLNEHLRQ
jgi:hypothetical protein